MALITMLVLFVFAISKKSLLREEFIVVPGEVGGGINKSCGRNPELFAS